MDKFDITTIPVTAKLMLLRAGAKNFRTVGDEQIINFTEDNNTLIVGEDNGVGKSTLYLFLPYYCLTGKSYKAGDSVDALLNSDRFKLMTTFLEFHFAGTYYRVERGRKPTIFNILSLVDSEWVEIPNLPVSSRDRQNYLYSLLGMNKTSAEKLIENSFLLGVRKFSGFLAMDTEGRRQLIEPIFDLTIFSQLNKQAKSERSTLIVEQKQTGLEITDLDLKVALAGQAVTHSLQEKNTLEGAWESREDVLTTQVSNDKRELEEAREVDVSGVEINEIHSKAHYNLCWKTLELDAKLKVDSDNLGEFVIDEKDKVLVKLGNDIEAIDHNIKLAEESVKEKSKSFEGDLTRIVEQTNKDIATEKSRYNDEVKAVTETSEDCIKGYKDKVKAQQLTVDCSETDQTEAKAHGKDCEDNVEHLTKELEDLTVKENQYKGKIDKLKVARDFLLTKVAIEESNLLGLVEAGECPTCKQLISQEYLESCKAGINTKLLALKEDVAVYTGRMDAGEVKVKDLSVDEATEGLRVAVLQKDQALQGYFNSGMVLKDQRAILEDLQWKLEVSMDGLPNELTRAKDKHERTVGNLNLVLGTAEGKVQKILGSLESDYKSLVESKPTQVSNILQQIEDRKEAMKGSHGGKERNLKDVHKLSVDNIGIQIETLDSQLVKDLQQLVENKNRDVTLKETGVADSEGTLGLEKVTFKGKLQTAELKIKDGNQKSSSLKGKLTKLNTLHDKQQHDIEDYDNLLILLSDSCGKADILKTYMPKLNESINNYLESMSFYSEITIDEHFKITMADEERRGQSLYSLSEGETAKVNLSVMLSLREIAQQKASIDTNLLVMDEVLENLHSSGVQDCVDMLKSEFGDLNLFVISQKNSDLPEMFDVVKTYGKRGGFTTLVNNE